MEEEALILFSQCPRCGGDIDATFAEDVHCIQCGDRPDVVYPGPVVLGAGARASLAEAPSGSPSLAAMCPRCGTDGSVMLQKVRPDYNTCFRCRKCSHVYSP